LTFKVNYRWKKELEKLEITFRVIDLGVVELRKELNPESACSVKRKSFKMRTSVRRGLKRIF